MTESQPTPTQPVRIAGHLTQSRFLHVEDALGIDKLRIFAGVYGQSGMLSHSRHYVDLADARVIFGALACSEPGFSYREYKGTPLPNHQDSSHGGAVSRVLSIAVKGDMVYIELKSGPGKLTTTGAVTPNGKAQVEINVGFKLYEAQRLAATVLAYIHAWDVYRIMCHQQLVGAPAPYLLSLAEARNGSDHELREQDLVTDPQTKIPNGKRPVTRKGAIPTTNGSPTAAGAETGTPPPPVHSVIRPTVAATAEAIYGSSDLRYGDGSTVDEANSVELRTFRQFVAEKQTAPASRTALQVYYRQYASIH